MDVIEAVKGLMLDTLDSDYIESVWSQEFMGGAELPDLYKEYCDKHAIQVVSEVSAAIDRWQAVEQCTVRPGNINTEEIQDKSWKLLMELQFDYKALLSVLWSFITNGQRNKYDEASRILSLKASTLYLKLLSVSGSRVFHAFHPYLCLKSVNILKFGILATFKQKKKSKKCSTEVTADEMLTNDMGEIQLSVQETSSLLNELVMVLCALQLFVTKFSLESQEELLEEIVKRLTEITRLEVNTSNFMTYRRLNRSVMDKGVSSLAYSAYECLKLLCSPQHGDLEDIVIIIMKHLLPSVLLSDHDLSFRELCTIREHAVHFIKYLLFTLKDVTHRGITIFIHHVFTRIGEKAETRQKGKETIVDIMKIMPYKQYTDLVRWLFDCAHSDKASYRLLAVEVISQLLYEEPQVSASTSIASGHDSCVSYNSGSDASTEPGRPQDNSSTDNSPSSACCAREGDMLYKYMLAVIFARCRDSSGIVRARALSLLVQCMRSDNMVVCSLFNEIFVLNQQCSGNEKVFLNYKQIIVALENKSAMNPLPGARVIIGEFKNLACDSKVNVRKAALQALESIMKLNRSWLTENILEVLKKQQETSVKYLLDRSLAHYGYIILLGDVSHLQIFDAIVLKLHYTQCQSVLKFTTFMFSDEFIYTFYFSVMMLGSTCRDPAVSVRKEMVQILSDLLQQYPDDRKLAKIWAKCVVPLVLDQEGKLQECVLKVMSLVIMDNLTEYSRQQDNIWYALPWQLLTYIVEFNLHVCFMKACEVWVKEKEIRNSLVNDLCTHVGTENNTPTWIVLYCLSTQMDFKNPMFAVEYYRQTVTSNEGSVSLLVIVLEVLLSCCGNLPHHVQKDMLKELVDGLCNFSVQRELIRLNVEIAIQLTHHLVESKKEARKKVKSWTGDLLQRSQLYLENTLKRDSTKVLDKDQFLCHLHTVGEVAMHNPRQLDEKTFRLLQQFLFISDANSMGDIATDPVAKALTVVTVGKLCVLNQMWAKQLTRPLVKLLKISQDLPTLMNIIYVLRDLCVRYGAMMEPHLLSLWLCLKDTVVEVRITTLTCLVELLQGNYIKCRGAMFFHLLSMLCDLDENVVELTTYFLRDYVVATNKNIMYEHFIDALFHFNGYQGHEVYGKCSMTREERENFLMKGDKFRESRELLYGFMLENMDDEHRMLSRNNLVMKVLDGASEGQVRLDEDGENVVLDAIHILNSKQICLSALQQECDDDPAAENIDKVTNILVKARNKAIGECEKKNMIENIVPVIIHLKAVLQEKYSRLVPRLMQYVRDMMKEYKNEVKEIFAEDQQMAIEILHDISEHEKKEKESENMQRREEDVSCRTSEHIPSRVNALLQSSSPWVRQSLGPEISRCYRIGGDELMVRYAHAKLQHLRNQTQRRSESGRRSSQLVEDREDFIEDLKQESTGEDGDSEEEYEVRESGEEELEVRETEGGRLKDKVNIEAELGVGESEVRVTGVAVFEVRLTVEEGVVDRVTVDTEFGMRELDEGEFDVGETVEKEFEIQGSLEKGVEGGETVEAEFEMRRPDEGEFDVGKTVEKEFEIRGSLEKGVEDGETVRAEFEMRETSEENEVGKMLEETAETAGSLDLEVELREILEDDEMRKTLGKKDETELAIEGGVRNAESHIKETVSQNMNGQDKDYEMPRTNAGNGTPETRRGGNAVSTPIVPGETNVTFSSSVSAIDSETLYFRPPEDR